MRNDHIPTRYPDLGNPRPANGMDTANKNSACVTRVTKLYGGFH